MHVCLRSSRARFDSSAGNKDCRQPRGSLKAICVSAFWFLSLECGGCTRLCEGRRPGSTPGRDTFYTRYQSGCSSDQRGPNANSGSVESSANLGLDFNRAKSCITSRERTASSSLLHDRSASMPFVRAACSSRCTRIRNSSDIFKL